MRLCRLQRLNTVIASFVLEFNIGPLAPLRRFFHVAFDEPHIGSVYVMTRRRTMAVSTCLHDFDVGITSTSFGHIQHRWGLRKHAKLHRPLF